MLINQINHLSNFSDYQNLYQKLNFLKNKKQSLKKEYHCKGIKLTRITYKKSYKMAYLTHSGKRYPILTLYANIQIRINP